MSERVYMVTRETAARLARRAHPENLAEPLKRTIGSFKPTAARIGAAAVVRVDGVVVMDSDWFYDDVTAVPALALAGLIRELAADASVSTIVLDMHCPGWSSAGASDVVAALDAARATKHLWAVAHDMACSGGMAIGACCERFVATPTAMLGSMGTLMMLYDSSKAFEKNGVTPVVVAEPSDAKAEGYPGVAITDATRENCAGVVAAHHAWYLGVLARRGITAEKVRALAAGVYAANDALAHGLVDEILTHESIMAQAAAMPSKRIASGASPALTNRGTPAKETAMTLDQLRQEHPDLVRAIADQAVQDAAAQPASFKALAALYGEKDKAFITECLEQEFTLAQAAGAWAEKAEARAVKAEKALAEANDKLASGALGEDPVTGPARAGGGGAQTLEAVARSIMAQEKCSPAVAIYKAAQSSPQLHSEWRSRGCPSMTA